MGGGRGSVREGVVCGVWVEGGMVCGKRGKDTKVIALN